jgi:hypothetical protein
MLEAGAEGTVSTVPFRPFNGAFVLVKSTKRETIKARMASISRSLWRSRDNFQTRQLGILSIRLM